MCISELNFVLIKMQIDYKVFRNYILTFNIFFKVDKKISSLSPKNVL